CETTGIDCTVGHVVEPGWSFSELLLSGSGSQNKWKHKKQNHRESPHGFPISFGARLAAGLGVQHTSRGTRKGALLRRRRRGRKWVEFTMAGGKKLLAKGLKLEQANGLSAVWSSSSPSFRPRSCTSGGAVNEVGTVGMIPIGIFAVWSLEESNMAENRSRLGSASSS